MSQKEQPSVLGLSIGTRSCFVGINSTGVPEIIVNEQGNRITPVFVAFPEDDSPLGENIEPIFGDTALGQMQRNQQRTIFDLLRFIGNENDTDCDRFEREYPFEITSSKKDGVFLLKLKNKPQKAEDILTSFIRHIRHIAEQYTGKTLRHCVLTYPVWFGPSQINALFQAVQAAGLKCLSMVSEPYAIAISFDLDTQNPAILGFNKEQPSTNSNPNEIVLKSAKRWILVFDCGASFTDVSLISWNQGLLTVETSITDSCLSTGKMVNILTEHCAKQFLQTRRADLRDSPRAMLKLSLECEKLLERLSQQNQSQASLFIDSLYEGMDFQMNVSQVRFEDLCSNLFSTIGSLVDRCLNKFEFGLSRDDISAVLLAGGGSRIPKINSILQSIFKNAKFSTDFFRAPPEEASILGATIETFELWDWLSSHNSINNTNQAQPFNSQFSNTVFHTCDSCISILLYFDGMAPEQGNLCILTQLDELLPIRNKKFTINFPKSVLEIISQSANTSDDIDEQIRAKLFCQVTEEKRFTEGNDEQIESKVGSEVSDRKVNVNQLQKRLIGVIELDSVPLLNESEFTATIEILFSLSNEGELSIVLTEQVTQLSAKLQLSPENT